MLYILLFSNVEIRDAFTHAVNISVFENTLNVPESIDKEHAQNINKYV